MGWNIDSNKLPAAVPKNYPKRRWLVKSGLRVFFMYLGLDLTSVILTRISKPEPFFEQPLGHQVFSAWTQAFRTYYSIELAYYSAAIIGVVIGFGTPSDWPPVSGSFRNDGYTIRKMWGTCWHQMTRRPCSEAGRVVKEICGFKKGTFLSKYSQIWVAFFVSLIAHHAGAIVACFEDGGLWQAVYFMIQPVGIMLEDLVIFTGAKMGISQNGESLSCYSWSLRQNPPINV